MLSLTQLLKTSIHVNMHQLLQVEQVAHQEWDTGFLEVLFLHFEDLYFPTCNKVSSIKIKFGKREKKNQLSSSMKMQRGIVWSPQVEVLKPIDQISFQVSSTIG